jgi:hypothetical protein
MLCCALVVLLFASPILICYRIYYGVIWFLILEESIRFIILLSIVGGIVIIGSMIIAIRIINYNKNYYDLRGMEWLKKYDKKLCNGRIKRCI